jgi:FAD/FMN-containing dehydrogenase
MNSFGNYPNSNPRTVHHIAWQDSIIQTIRGFESSFLPIGMRRSYGDSCLNNDSILLDMTGMNKLIAFDRQKGIMLCEGGITFHELLTVIVPAGYFLPVTPGTQYITVGGAIANDIHGKNHHKAGTFGNHVNRIGLIRSDQEEILICSEFENSELFHATIGGLGLTGIIAWAEFSLTKIPSSNIESKNEQYHGYDEYVEIAKREEAACDYTVSWFDCFSGDARELRGLYTSGNFVDGNEYTSPRSSIVIPFQAPEMLLNRYSISLFNELYFRKQIKKVKKSTSHYKPFFYPLDALGDWNKLYGKSGFLQYQCVIPYDSAHDIISEMLGLMNKKKMGSFLVVLKSFGDIQSKGLLSFPMPGITIALDFPMRGKETLNLLDQFDEILHEVGGRVYPAKDARMSPKHFKEWYPAFEEIEKLKDPMIESTFWKRMMN